MGAPSQKSSSYVGYVGKTPNSIQNALLSYTCLGSYLETLLIAPSFNPPSQSYTNQLSQRFLDIRILKREMRLTGLVAALIVAPLATLAAPVAIDSDLVLVVERQNRPAKPKPCVRITPDPTPQVYKERFTNFADAFIVKKNISAAFEFIAQDYIVRHHLLTPLSLSSPPPVPFPVTFPPEKKNATNKPMLSQCGGRFGLIKNGFH